MKEVDLRPLGVKNRFMADQKIDDQKHDQEIKSDIEALGDPAALDLMDQAIADHDPEFKKKLAEIGPDLKPENIDLEDDLVEHATSSHAEPKNKVLVLLKKFRRWVNHRIKFFITRTVLFLKQTLPEIARYVLKKLKEGLSILKGVLAKFGKLKGSQKLVLAFCLLVAFGTCAIFYYSSRGGILPEKDQLFTPNLEQLGQEVFFVGKDEEFESFYDSPRASQNVVLLKRMFVNLKATEASPSSMAAIELYIEGYAPEVVVEVKDREAEVQDLFQREIEEMSYEELETARGKKTLLEKLRESVNRVLTQGKVKRVFLKNFILKN